jgi:signal transduction histidine kinase/DNA-binding response OmpR family regulator/ligand-binding sensor domain-containing protein
MKTPAIIFILFWFASSIQAQDINFQHIGPGSGLSQISVMSIYQDELGYMWFGTREGLNRYDGQEIKVYLAAENPDGGLPGNIINKIAGDRNGKMFLLVDYKHFVAYDLHHDRFFSIDERSQCFYADADNVVYARDNKIYVLNTDDFSSTHIYTLNVSYPITSLHLTSNQRMYIGTENGLFVLDNNRVFNTVFPGKHISVIFEDSKKNIWVGTSNDGVHKINRNGLVDHYMHQSKGQYSLSSNIIRGFTEDTFGQIWVATFKGLDKIVADTDIIVNYKTQGDKPTDLSHSSIYALYKDQQGTIWIGTYYGGVNYHHPESNIYTYYYPNINNPRNISFPIVGKMAEDKDGNLWICTEGGGLNFYDRRKREFKRFQQGGSNSISHNNLKCIYYNPKNQKLYIGTHMGGLSIYDMRTGRFKEISTRTNSIIPNDVIEDIVPYDNQLLILTQKGLVKMDMDTELVSPFFTDKELLKTDGKAFVTLLVDNKKQLWLSQNDGGVKAYNLRTGEMKTYLPSIENEGTIGRHFVTRIYQSKRGKLFFATYGSGLYEYVPETDGFKRFTVKESGLLADFIYDVTETNYGYLILLTNQGVNLLEPESGRNYHLDKTRGLPLDMINFGCGLITTSNGEIFVGGINGMASFYENQINPIPSDYQLFFSELQVNNFLIRPLDEHGILPKALPFMDKISLRHNENDILIRIANSNHIMANRTSYEYRLEGLDEQWSPVKDQGIKYTNLSPGNYVLHVREVAGYHPSGSRKEVHLAILVRPPFYLSLWAYILYSILISALLWWIIRFNKSKILLKTSLEYEKRENDRIKELNQTKLQFFTNISHEFRTPLTLIIGQIESMTQMENLSPYIRNKLVKVYKNASHLRVLITELLDFRKQERDMLSLKVTSQNIVPFVKGVFTSFNDMAVTRKMNYTFFSVEKDILLWFDPVQLQKVMYNLISNAFKYTPDHGSIAVKIEKFHDEVRISVKDDGEGIPEQDLTRIFERFYQSESKPAPHAFSTGVGLALSKGIVELHHGNIFAQRNKAKGSTLTVILKTGSDHFTDEEKAPYKEMDLNSIVESNLPDKLFMETVAQAEEVDSVDEMRAVILIVEDNEEMLHFLSDIFSMIYRVETASDGAAALDRIRDVQPDIVLSDVMMPNMSGKDLCIRLKTNLETSHIPVVLLTADASEDQSLESLMLGADDYITKPFNVKALISRCNNLVQNRKRMQEKFSRQTDNATVKLATNKLDQELLEKATAIVHSHLDDGEFDVSQFASEMALGRSKLYLKLKGITGMTPNEFILNTRLKTAANLLANTTDLNISDITYQMGFSTPRYFSKCFKELFGMSPMTYRKKHNAAYDQASEEEDDGLG